MLTVVENKLTMCINCGKFVTSADIYIKGKEDCFCQDCKDKYPKKWSNDKLRNLLWIGISKNASSYTYTYIQNLPNVLKKKAQENYERHLAKRKIKYKFTI